jgi:hypothetical protein
MEVMNARGKNNVNKPKQFYSSESFKLSLIINNLGLHLKLIIVFVNMQSSPVELERFNKSTATCK